MNTPAKHILVIEDDGEIREFVRLALSDEGYKVTTAPNGVVAIKLINEEALEPDMLIVDMRMPQMDGQTFLKLYRQTTRIPAPVLIFSAANDSTQKVAQTIGEGYLAKPFELEDLLEAVTRLITK